MEEVFEVRLGEEADNRSLQDAFKTFREKRRTELREQSEAQTAVRERQRAPAAMDRLREKFLQAALSYCGVPYARKYHPPESPTHQAPLFLDCCGLVRRVVRDLKEGFGFTIGPWNQAYQFDTLPLTLSGPEEMRPGDLVFISGTYFSEHSKQQRHGMVHVEIWMGQGEKTVGARWQRGRVEVHESYQFVSKSYHSMQYHFRSIDTWLQGVCRSCCPEHEWKVRDFTPGKYSLFSAQQDQSCGQAEEEEEGDDEASGGGQGEGEGEHEACGAGEKVQEGGAQGQVGGAQGPGSPNKPCKPDSGRTRRSRSRGVRGHARTFIVRGGNAAPLVHDALVTRGWLPLDDNTSSTFTLKWVETSKHINYRTFRAGEQMVNHFPNISVLTTKIGLLESLRTLQHLQQSTGMRGVKPSSFLPETYRLDKDNELSEFNREYCCGDVWICKPTGANQGKGIFLVRELQQVTERLEEDRRNCKIASRPTPRIVQRYITPPLLLGGRKFDIRVYLLLVAARPYLALYADGYVRLSCAAYSAASADLTVHLTNQYQQRKHPDFSAMREDTVWDLPKLQEQLSSEHSLPQDWVQSSLTCRMKAIMLTCLHSVRHKLSHSIGYFDLLGFDFMLDAQFNVWLIEVNMNPALHTTCATLRNLMPPLLRETLDIAIEVFDKCRRSRPVLPLTSASLFSPILS